MLSKQARVIDMCIPINTLFLFVASLCVFCLLLCIILDRLVFRKEEKYWGAFGKRVNCTECGYVSRKEDEEINYMTSVCPKCGNSHLRHVTARFARSNSGHPLSPDNYHESEILEGDT